MNIKRLILSKWIRGRKPVPVILDLVFIGLVVMLVIPGTRVFIQSGVAAVRTWIAPVGNVSKILDDRDWNWRYLDNDGHEVSFFDLKGRVILLNQWATWCPPCRAEMPALEALYRDYGNQVAFVLLTDENPGIVRDFLAKKGMNLPVCIGRVTTGGLVSRSIPTTVIISPNGEIVLERKGAFNWNARKIRNFLDKWTGV